MLSAWQLPSVNCVLSRPHGGVTETRQRPRR
jgi:hypothetical protein